jgi:CHAD domain-containing protein
VAPLAASLAASAALGVGVALAKAGSDRRTVRRRRRERKLGLGADERLAAGLRRMALAQADLALEALEKATGEDAKQAIHTTRKAIKRMRTIVRLLVGELGERECAREQATLRAAADGLAGARDAEVMLATLEALVTRHPGRLAGKRGITAIRDRLAADRAQAQRAVEDPANRLAVARELRAFRTRAAAWDLLDRGAIAPVEVGLRRIYRQGRRRFEKASRASAGRRMRAMHQWRKRVKDLRYAAEALERAEARTGLMGGGGSRRQSKRARREARWLRKLAARADDLGELLGEEHDLAVLEQWLERSGGSSGAGRRTRRRLLKLIARRRKQLRRRTLREGGRIYERRPGPFIGRVSRAYQRSGRKLS